MLKFSAKDLKPVLLEARKKPLWRGTGQGSWRLYYV